MGGRDAAAPMQGTRDGASKRALKKPRWYRIVGPEPRVQPKFLKFQESCYEGHLKKVHSFGHNLGSRVQRKGPL